MLSVWMEFGFNGWSLAPINDVNFSQAENKEE